MSHRMRLVVVVAVAAAALLIALRVSSDKPVPITAATVHAGPLESWVTTNGVVEPIDPHQLRAPLPAFVRTVSVLEGQAVRKNDVLMTLDFAGQKAELAHAREDLAQAENQLKLDEAGGAADERAAAASDLRKSDADVAHLRGERDTLTRLLAEKAATRQELDQVALDLARAEATHEALAAKVQTLARQAAANAQTHRYAVERARETAALLERQLASETLRAPIDGTVYSLPVHTGGRVDTGDLLAAVGDLRAMQVRAFVDEPELASIETSQLVQIAWSGRTWTGRVERLPGAIIVRGERHVGEVICSLDDSRQLIPNLDVDVKIRLQSRARALLVPREAVHRDQSGPPFVFLVQDGTLQRRPVSIDVASPTDDAIRSGVAEGDIVALAGSLNLQEGMRVRVAP